MGSKQRERERREREERERREREERERREREERERREAEKKRRREREMELERKRKEMERLERENRERERRERERRERERRERERRERERREREERQRERERQLRIEEEITRKIESKIKDLRNEIISFKSNFEKNYLDDKECYKKYFKESQDLLEKVENRQRNYNIDYPYEEKKELQKKIINYEIKNLKKFLYENLYKIINNLGENRKFSECLEVINELENNFSLNEIDFLNYQKENYKKDLKTIKNHCKLMLKSNESKELFKRGNFDESIKYLNEIYLNSTTDTERELFSKEILNMKIENINNITNKNIILLHSNRNEDIIKESERILNKFNDDIDLLKPLHEMEVVYCKALQNIILSKKKNGENFDKEFYKYEAIVETERFSKEYKDFINKIKSDNKLNNELNEETNSNDSKYVKESKPISEGIIKKYLSDLKKKNKIKNQKEFEELELDILTQVNNYNKELQNKMTFPKWFEENKDNINKNEFRGNVFGFLNIINKPIIKYDIRPIQLISLLFLSKNNTSDKNSKSQGIFLQINTGEGKSLIIQFFAAYLALQGKKVDIITSNSVLADRDAEDPNKIKFYEALNLSVGCASKDEYFKNIVYGDTTNFEAAILREEFKEKDVRSERPFDCIIVDEVDSISLDNIITMTQLTDNFPGRSCFYFFYYQILLFYCNYISSMAEQTGKTQEEYLRNPKEFEQEIKKVIKENLKEKFMEDDGKTLKKDLPIIYPKCMKKYIEDSLDTWIENVIKAPTMIEEKDFIKKENNIVPIDYSNTGVVQNNMVWDGGLQQILQIIHDENGTYENENTNFLSNISFFKRYDGNIYGVTGTFGGNNFQNILKEVYEVKLYIIPPNKKSLLEDTGPKICKNKDEYFNAIKENINNLISQNRSVLIICNSINEGKELYEILLDICEPKNIMQYYTEDDKATIEKTLEIKKIIVATNLAGRGTDIKISDELESNGGLHVIVSFLPLNQRIEDQNYGRAGRKGQRGSYNLIMLYNEEYGPLDDDMSDESKLIEIKLRREKAEYEGIKSLKENDKIFIEQKEEIFQQLCLFLNINCKEINKFERASIEEKWGILLKAPDIETIRNGYQKLINENIKEIKNNLIKIQKIVKYSESNTTIFEQEYEYSWAARLVYACNLAKKKVENNDLSNLRESVSQFETVKTILNEAFMIDLSTQSTLNKLVFSLFVMNQEKIKDENFKTKIELQNENKKNFLEVLQSLIDKNIDTVNKYIAEYKDRPDDVIETQTFLKIETIINDSEKVDNKYKEDIEIYMYEFGLEKFEILVIRKEFHLLSNLIVFAIGVLEISAGTALFFLSKNPKVLQFAKFLVKEGISDIIESVKATLKGEEINLKNFAIKKGISILAFSLSLFTCGREAPSLKDTLLGMVKDKVFSHLKEHGTTWAANKIMGEINKRFSEKIKDQLFKFDLLKFDGEDNEYILYNIIINRDFFESNLIKKVKDIISDAEKLMEFIGPIINFIKELTDRNKCGMEKFNSFLNFVNTFNFKGCKKCLEDIIKQIKNTKINYEIDKNLFTLMLKSNKDFGEEKVDNIIKELIECGAIDQKEGIFNMDFIENKDFVQSFKFIIDKKFKDIKFNEGKEVSKETLEFLNSFKDKFSLNALNNKKKIIQDQVYKVIENHLQKYIKMILDYLLNKASKELDNLCNKSKYLSMSKGKSNTNANLYKAIGKTGLKFLSKELINKLLKWIKDRIDELINLILSKFDALFEEIGEKIIIIQEKTGNIIDKILEKVEQIKNLVGDIKRIIKNIINIIKSSGNIQKVITNLVDISDFMLKNGIENLTKPINDCVNVIRNGIKNTIETEYNKIKNKGIDYYEKGKNKINKEYNYIKNKVVNLPDDLAKKLDEKKKEFLEEYNKDKELIIKHTDIKLNIVIDTQKIEKIFYDIINTVKSNIVKEANQIKDEIKNKINDYNKFIMDLYNDIICFIDDCMKSDICEYVDNKLYALEQTVIFILDVISEKYETENFNENILGELLISHFQTKIDKFQEFCVFLIGKGLLSHIIKIREYTKGKLCTIQTLYDTILDMSKKYLNLLLQNAEGYLSKYSKCFDNVFDYFIQYINKIYNNCCIYELYFINKLKSINSFIFDITSQINKKKNEEIKKLSNKLEQKIENEYNKLMRLKDNVKNTINSTFETFENRAIKPVENKICETATEIENKLIEVAYNLDEKAENYLQMIYPKDIDSKLFGLLKKKKDNLLTKLDNEELNAGINKFCNSKIINKTENIIDKIDLDKATSIIYDIKNISNSLKISNKYEFRDNIKRKIKEKILFLYSTKIEINLKKFIEEICSELINKI